MSATSSSPHSSSSPSDGPIPDDPHTAADLPLPMTASVILEHLPRDAQTALEKAGELGVSKVTIRLQPIASAPALRQRVFKISSSQPFEAVIKFLRRKLAAALREHESVFCYINNVFAPSPDENVGNLWRCFRSGDELVVGYAIAPAFG
ncbi:ubiquitin-like autophagy protein Apg12-domain-containing protein [Cryomyces antarcticus]